MGSLQRRTGARRHRRDRHADRRRGRRPAVHARPDGMPRAGVVLHPDIGGLRPLFEDMARRLATHGLAVCAVEPFAAPARGRARRRSRARMAAREGPRRRAAARDLSSAADLLVVEDDVSRVSRARLLHGRPLHVQGRGDRPLRRRGRVLRDAAHARRLAAGPATRSSRSTVAARDVPDARDLRVGRPVDARRRHRRAARRVERTGPTARSS